MPKRTENDTPAQVLPQSLSECSEACPEQVPPSLAFPFSQALLCRSISERSTSVFTNFAPANRRETLRRMLVSSKRQQETRIMRETSNQQVIVVTDAAIQRDHTSVRSPRGAFPSRTSGAPAIAGYIRSLRPARDFPSTNGGLCSCVLRVRRG